MAAVAAQRHTPLIVWSVPPSPDLLRWLADTVEPPAIYLCGNQTADDALPHTVRHVAGMCKHALAYDKSLNVERMAARLGVTEAVIRRSLLWLEARGLIVVAEWGQADALRIEAGSPRASRLPSGGDAARSAAGAADLIEAELEQSLAEVRAYRRYYLRAGLHELGLDIEPSVR